MLALNAIEIMATEINNKNERWRLALVTNYPDM